MTTNILTKTKPTWCPGCFNFQILAGVKKVIGIVVAKTQTKKLLPF